VSEKETYTIELGSKIVLLTLTPFNSDVDVDELTKIQYHNIIGELLTSSTQLNRIGNLLAEMEEMLSMAKLDFDIFQAQMAEQKRKELTFSETDDKGKVKVNKPTIPELESSIIRTPEYKVKKTRLFRLQKERDYVNSLYWSLKSKDDKIVKLTEKLKPEEFENDIIEGEINGILIKVAKKAIR
jgi:hypothetical protein